MLEIRNFGNDVCFTDIDLMINYLKVNYLNTSLSIILTLKNGVKHPIYISLNYAGDIVSTYKEGDDLELKSYIIDKLSN